jgi:cytochrome c2
LKNETALTDLVQKYSSKTINVFDPNENAQVSFKAVSAAEIFDQIYGREWRKKETVLITCADGYQPTVPVYRFVSEKAYFAVAREGQKDFSIINTTENKKKVAVGPIYLIWENAGKPDLQKGDGAFWPYQVVGFDFIKFSEKFPKLTPKQSSPAVVKGFYHFQKYCLACHKVNGAGGNTAPELNYPTSVTEFIKPGYLKKWLLNPQQMRFGTPMPGLASDLKNREQVADSIIIYLTAMSKNKQAP